MNKFFKMTLFLTLPLAFLLGCSKQSTTTSSSSSTPETTEVKASESSTTEKKSELKTATFVNDSQPGVVSTLTYTVDGDNVVKQTAHNVADCGAPSDQGARKGGAQGGRLAEKRMMVLRKQVVLQVLLRMWPHQ